MHQKEFGFVFLQHLDVLSYGLSVHVLHVLVLWYVVIIIVWLQVVAAQYVLLQIRDWQQQRISQHQS